MWTFADQSALDMPRASEPTLFLFLYLRKDDPRAVILKQVDAFVANYGLSPDSKSHYPRASEIDFAELERSLSNFELVFQAHTEYPPSRVGTYYECLAYVYHDALIVQITITKFSDWVGTFTAGWNELWSSLNSVFSAPSGALGVSAIYWAIAEDGSEAEWYSPEIRELAAGHNLQKTETDLGGPLWRCDRPMFPDSTELSQDLWMLVTPRSEESEKEVNRRFWQPYFSDPPDFAIVGLAEHKIAYERTLYARERPRLGIARASLDERASRLLEVQRHLSRELDELLSEEALEFQQQLAHAHASLADYRHFVSLLKELRRTVEINRRIYLINCVALVSSIWAKSVSRSLHQELAASEALVSSPQDEIFGSRLGRLQGFSKQLDSDIDYADSLIERHGATLQSAGEQLRISGERELGEMAHHLSIDSAAVVASVAAIIAVETVLKPSLDEHKQEIFAYALFSTLCIIAGSFAATQILSSGGRGKKLERWSLAVSLAFLAASQWARIPDAKFSVIPLPANLLHLLYILAGAAGFSLGWWIHRKIQRRARKSG